MVERLICYRIVAVWLPLRGNFWQASNKGSIRFLYNYDDNQLRLKFESAEGGLILFICFSCLALMVDVLLCCDDVAGLLVVSLVQ